eukprot:scaffold431460_cov33-Prasinocladus_malaysianus.AAC.2
MTIFLSTHIRHKVSAEEQLSAIGIALSACPFAIVFGYASREKDRYKGSYYITADIKQRRCSPATTIRQRRGVS